jgi:hypothetical protein
MKGENHKSHHEGENHTFSNLASRRRKKLHIQQFGIMEEKTGHSAIGIMKEKNTAHPAIGIMKEKKTAHSAIGIMKEKTTHSAIGIMKEAGKTHTFLQFAS